MNIYVVIREIQGEAGLLGIDIGPVYMGMDEAVRVESSYLFVAYPGCRIKASREFPDYAELFTAVDGIDITVMITRRKLFLMSGGK